MCFLPLEGFTTSKSVLSLSLPARNKLTSSSFPPTYFTEQNLIWSLTEVPPERIKLLGLSSLKIPLEDSQTLAELKIKKGGKFVMIGTSSPLLRLRSSALLAGVIRLSFCFVFWGL